ncbi:MAG: T9SS type A sorting domain-containing protein, partial [Candidatus Fermentibacteraceae bacterium]|nr:T9SS type A sorting domain-containing protein [Candidatus Fermentibacteraceae bacterium]
VGAYPWNLCCHPDGDFVYVACVDSDVVSVIGHSSTGIEAQDNQGAPSFCVSPNPGYGAFELTLFILTSAGEMGFSKVEVFDVSGRLVFSEDLSWSQVGEHTFNISVSTPGLYLCRTSIAGTEFSASFVCLP